jgi:hypothetical protein
MPKLMTQPDLDAGLVERVAHAVYRAELLTLFPHHDAASADLDSPRWKQHWEGQPARTRMSYRQQAIAALRASELLERVAELERAIEQANTDLAAYAHDKDGNAWARRDVTAHLRKVHDKQIG